MIGIPGGVTETTDAQTTTPLVNVTQTSAPIDAVAGSSLEIQERFILTVTFVALAVLLVIIFSGLVMMILPPIRCIQRCCACQCKRRPAREQPAQEAPPPEDVWM